MRYDVVHNTSVNFENDFVCKILNKSEPSCLLEMVLSIITLGTSLDENYTEVESRPIAYQVPRHLVQNLLGWSSL